MKGIEKLTFITDEQRKQLIQSAQYYKRFAGVYFEIRSVDEPIKSISVIGTDTETIYIRIKVYQLRSELKKFLTEKELVERGVEVFGEILPTSKDETISLSKSYPENENRAVYSLLTENGRFTIDQSFFAIPCRLENVMSIDFIRRKKEEHDLLDVDLARLLNIRPENISRVMNGNRGLTKLGEAAFYYLFKYLEK